MIFVRLTSKYKSSYNIGINKSQSVDFGLPPAWTPAYPGGFFRPDHDPPLIRNLSHLKPVSDFTIA